jgi:hypothetical protein
VNDRQRVEIALIPRFLYPLVVHGTSDPDAPEAKELVACLKDASIESFADLYPPEQKKLIRRVERAYDDLFRRYHGNANDKLGAVWFSLLQHLTATEYLVLYEGSRMARAMELMIPMFEHVLDEPKRARSARKEARRLLAHLQQAGFYRGALSFDEAAGVYGQPAHAEGARA